MSLIGDYKEAFKEAEELLHTLVLITVNSVDPKDFGSIRQRAKDWLNTHTGNYYPNDRDLLKSKNSETGSLPAEKK